MAGRTVWAYARRRWRLLAFVAILSAYRATQWGHFAVPAPDFFDFEDTARWLAHGHLPQQFQRGPLYPALIAILSPLFGGDRPTLVAAQALNLALSAAALLIMYELCALLVGRWALLVVMLSGLHWTMAYVTVHPLVEPTLMTAALAALYLDTAGRRGKYVAAGLAAAARYDGLCVIGALALSDLRRRRSRWRIAATAILAAAPALLWVSIGAARVAPNAYTAVMETQAPAGWEFLRSLGMSTMSFVPVQALEGVLAGGDAWRYALFGAAGVGALLAAVGCRQWIRRRDLAVPGLAFAGLYVAVHLIYPAANTRFALPVVWLAHVMMVMGGIAVGRRLRLSARGWRWAAAAALSVGACAGAVWAARRDAAWVLPLAAPTALAVAGANMGARPYRPREVRRATSVGSRAQVGARLIAALPVLALVVAGSLGLSGWYLDRESRWWAEMQPVARWCERPQAALRQAQDRPCSAMEGRPERSRGAAHRPRAHPARMALTRSALSVLSKLCARPRVEFYDLAALNPEAPALPPDVRYLLWSSTDTPPEREAAQTVLSRRYAEDRDRVVPTGRWYVREVAARGAHAPGGPWRVCARFSSRGQRAVIYVRGL